MEKTRLSSGWWVEHSEREIKCTDGAIVYVVLQTTDEGITRVFHVSNNEAAAELLVQFKNKFGEDYKYSYVAKVVRA